MERGAAGLAVFGCQNVSARCGKRFETGRRKSAVIPASYQGERSEVKKDHSRSQRLKRGELALKGGARVISYEYWMLKEALRYWQKDCAGQPTRSASRCNMAIEAALIHARNLLAFFSAGGHKDDVKATDFITPVPRIALPYLRRNKKRMNKKLAHPSYAGKRMGASWNGKLIEEELDSAFRVFLARLEAMAPKRRRYFPIH